MKTRRFTKTPYNREKNVTFLVLLRPDVIHAFLYSISLAALTRYLLYSGVVETGLFVNMAHHVYFGLADGSVEHIQRPSK